MISYLDNHKKNKNLSFTLVNFYFWENYSIREINHSHSKSRTIFLKINFHKEWKELLYIHCNYNTWTVVYS